MANNAVAVGAAAAFAVVVVVVVIWLWFCLIHKQICISISNVKIFAFTGVASASLSVSLRQFRNNPCDLYASLLVTSIKCHPIFSCVVLNLDRDTYGHPYPNLSIQLLQHRFLSIPPNLNPPPLCTCVHNVLYAITWMEFW